MSISIKYYRVEGVEHLHELKDIPAQISKFEGVDLYKITEELAIIYSNSLEPYDDTLALTYKVLFGNFVQVPIDHRCINGFIPASEVPVVYNWMKERQLNSYEGFLAMFEKNSEEVKEAVGHVLDEGEPFFDAYVKALFDFYNQAIMDRNSIIILGE